MYSTVWIVLDSPICVLSCLYLCMYLALRDGQADQPPRPIERHTLQVEPGHINESIKQTLAGEGEGQHVGKASFWEHFIWFCIRHVHDIPGVAAFCVIMIVYLKVQAGVIILIKLVVLIPLYLGAIRCRHNGTRPPGMIRVVIQTAYLSSCRSDWPGAPQLNLSKRAGILPDVDAFRLEIRPYRVGVYSSAYVVSHLCQCVLGWCSCSFSLLSCSDTPSLCHILQGVFYAAMRYVCQLCACSLKQIQRMFYYLPCS